MKRLPSPQLALFLPLAGDPAKLTEAELDQMFERWYAAYPRHQSRKDGRKAFGVVITTGEATLNDLMQGAERYAKHCTDEHTSARHTCLPATWLRGARWTDEFTDDAVSPERARSASLLKAASYFRGRAGLR